MFLMIIMHPLLTYLPPQKESPPGRKQFVKDKGKDFQLIYSEEVEECPN